MISIENIEKLARKYQTVVFPNILREYSQHIFLSELYKMPESDNLLFKGGTALRIIYGSPRFSEYLDFTLSKIPPKNTKTHIENILTKILSEISKSKINVVMGKKSGLTTGGYFGLIDFKIYDYPAITVEINISIRKKAKTDFEIDSIINDFTTPYNVIHLPQEEIVEEKVFGALLNRSKPRDFYDLYFIMRKGMLSIGQKRRLSNLKNNIIKLASKIDFRAELKAFLPIDQHAIIKDFCRVLEAEINRQIS